MSVPGGIVILDFGSQYTQLIARRIREQEVFSAVLPCTAPLEEVRRYQPVGVVLSGGPNSVYDPAAPACDPRVLQLGLPVLGICYGMQWVAHTLGGRVARAERREYGPAVLELVENGTRGTEGGASPAPTRSGQRGGSALFEGLPPRLNIWNSHGDHVESLPVGFRVTGKTENALAAAEDITRKIYTVEFHPEVRHTERGTDILRNFVFGICRARRNWSAEAFIKETVAAIRQRVGDRRALCALSGGVDSAVAGVLVHRAIGARLSNVFVDTGLLRKNEFRETLELLRGRMGLNVDGVDASARFLARLAGVSDPEEKRRRIGHEFIEVFAEEARKLKLGGAGALREGKASGGASTGTDRNVCPTQEIGFLVQGTLYPDVIESVSVRGPSQTIKTHHNVGGLPADLPFQLIEPLRDLFKDEVRRIGRDLGLPAEMLAKHPFPGPGLAVRMLGEVTPAGLATLREADAIVVEEIRAAGLYERVWQAFAVLLPVRSVGVMGDERHYGWTIAVRVVESEDAMTADWSRLPNEVLGRISSRIVNEVRGVTRVVYDISSKPPSTIEWE